MSHADRHFDHLDPSATHPSPLLFEKGRTLCFALVLLGALGVIFGAMMNPSRFYFSWLTGWAFCWTIMMGILFLVILHYLVDAGWDTVVRRPAEQVLSTMPIIVLGMIPIVIGLITGHLYGWVHPEQPLHGFKAFFLNPTFVLICIGIYAIIWLWLAHVLRRNSLRQDTDGQARWTISSNRWSAGGIVLYAFSLTGCSLHLLMSLDYHWFSTMFGVYIWTGGVVAGLATITLIALKLKTKVLRQYIGSDTVHDLGKLTFAFNCFWGYIAFSQYFLIWYGNIPEETVWFLNRWTGTTHPALWWPIGLLFPLGMFLIPFLVLMSAHTKRNERILGAMCIVMLVAHFLGTYWLVHPELRTNGIPTLVPPLSWIWMDLSVVLLLVGLCGILFISNLRSAALFPVLDPRLVEALSAEHVEEIEQADTE